MFTYRFCVFCFARHLLTRRLQLANIRYQLTNVAANLSKSNQIKSVLRLNNFKRMPQVNWIQLDNTHKWQRTTTTKSPLRKIKMLLHYLISPPSREPRTQQKNKYTQLIKTFMQMLWHDLSCHIGGHDCYTTCPFRIQLYFLINIIIKANKLCID